MVTYQGSYWNTVTNDYYGHVTIPETVTVGSDVYTVVAIGESAFAGCEKVTGVTLPKTIKSIGTAGFGVVEAETDFTSVYISDLAAWCNIDFANIASNPLSHAENFYLNGELLTEIVIPEGVEEIKSFAFYGLGSNVVNITIPSSVKKIGEDAFRGSAIKNVHISDLAAWCNIDFTGAYSNPLTNAENLYLNGEPVTALVIPDGVEEIKKNAFNGYSKLESISIPNSVTTIGSNAFGNTAWYNNQPDGVVYAGNVLYAYKGTMPSNTDIAIKEGTTGIVEYVFKNCSALKSVTIPNSVKNIGQEAFYKCTNLTSAIIGNGVTSIGDYAFAYCTNLKSVTIGNGVTNIGEYAFYGCSNLIDVYNNSSLDITAGSNENGYVAYYTNVVMKQDDTLELYGDYLFHKSGDTYTLIEYKGNGSTATLPQSFYGHNYKIGIKVFYNCTALKSVTIPNSVTAIGDYAFYGCSGLTSITIPNSVTTIGHNAFYGCSGLTSATIGNNVASIGERAFAICNGITSINIPSSVTTIGKDAFNSASSKLTAVHISDLSAWCRIEFENEYSNPLSNAKNLYLNGEKVTNLVVPENISEIKNYAFHGCSGLTNASIPNSATIIGDKAFASCSGLTSLTIGNSVTTIGNSAFYNCSGLTSITIPSSVTTIEKGAFSISNGKLTAVHISDLSAWCRIDFEDIYSNPLYYAKNLYLNGEKVTDLVVPNGVVEIKKNTFYNCTGLVSATIPSTVVSVGENAFYNCNSLTGIIIPKDVTSIGNSAFYGCSNLASLRLEKGTETLNLGNNVFYNSKITSLYLGRNISYKSDSPFKSLSSITSIQVANSVTTIPSDAFTSCSGLKNLRIEDSVEPLILGDSKSSSSSFGGSLTTLYIGRDIVYNSNYSPFKNNSVITSVEISDKVTTIGNEMFSNCTGLKSITIPNSVKIIGDWAFYGCTGLTSANIGNGVTTIGQQAFCNCSKLSDINLPDSVTSVGQYAFYNTAWYKNQPAGIVYAGKVLYVYNGTMPSGTDITIKDGTISIADNAFYGCSGLASITIPNSVTSIGEYAFCDCTGLTSVEIPNSVTSIGEDAFGGCDNLRTVYNNSSLDIAVGSSEYGYVAYYANAVIKAGDIVESMGDCVFHITNNATTLIGYTGSESVITLPENYNGNDYVIGAYAFYNCTQMTSVTIPECVTSIGNYAFAGCGNLAEVIIPNSISVIGNYAFSGCSNLAEVTIPSSVQAIGAYAFNANNNLKAVHISDLSAWCKIDFEDIYSNPLYYAKNLYLNEEKITSLFIPEDITEIKNFAFCNCTGLTNITLPNSVTKIGDSAFRGCSGITSISIPNSVVSIGSSVFYNCSGLASVSIGNNVAAIGNQAFYNCSKLKTVNNFSNITFIKGNTTYGYITYYAENILNAPNGSIEGDFIFGVYKGVNTLLKCTSVSNLYVDWTSTNKGANNSESKYTYTITAKQGDTISFDWMVSSEKKYDKFYVIINGTTVLTESGESSGNYKYTFPSDGVYTMIVKYAKDESDNSGQDCAKVYNIAFSGGVATVDVVLPDSYKGENYVIGAEVFSNCNLGNITIPAAVTGIGEKAFYGCTGLVGITSDIAAENLFVPGADAFTGVDKTKCTLYVPCGTKDTYATTEGWNEFENIVELEAEVAAGSCGVNVYWTLEDGVLTISGSGLMDDFTSLTQPWAKYRKEIQTIVIGEDVANIGASAFIYCSNLTSVQILEGITSLGAFAFEGCTSLREVEIPNSVTVIGECAFNWCAALENIEIPSSVTSIGYCAFGNCTALESVTSLVPADELFEAYAFDGLDFDACTLYVPYGAKAKYASTNNWNCFKNVVELRPEEITITINQYGSATYCSDFALDFSNVEGLKAYAATGYNSKTKVVTLTRLQTAMEGTGLFLIGEPGEYTVPVIEHSNDYTLNLLVGTLEKTTVNGTTDDGNYVNLKYTVKENNTPMFYQFEDGSSLSANKAYLQLPAALFPSNASKSVNLRFDDGETTDIDEVEGENGDVETVYDLQGRAVENPTKGVYIVNGKKVFINK